MIVKMQTEIGWEYNDRVKKVITGTQYTGSPQVIRKINVSPSGDHGPYAELQMIFDNGEMSEPIITNGDTYLLNDNGKTIERI
jgi:glutathione peroxidase-family protein